MATVAFHCKLGLFLFLFEKAIEFTLLKIADQNLLLLSLSHLPKLPKLILLENSKRFQIRDPLFSNLIIVNVHMLSFISAIRVKVLPSNNIDKLIILWFFL